MELMKDVVNVRARISAGLLKVNTARNCETRENTSVAVADPDPGSGAFLTPGPGSGIGIFRIPDLGSRIPTPYFLELGDKFLGKKFYNSLKTGSKFFLRHLKN
jgi:hypothetical protein